MNISGRIILCILGVSGTALSVVSSAAQPQFGENPYYANDIDKAVQEARRNPVDISYVGQRWYNRTTSRSFDFPKMLNREMGLETIAGALDPTAAGPGKEAPERLSPLQLDGDDVQDQEEETQVLQNLISSSAENTNPQITIIEQVDPPTRVFIEQVRYQGPDYTAQTNDIRATVTTTARLRP